MKLEIKDNTIYIDVDNSSIELLSTCPRKSYYTVLLRRVPAVRSAALTFGGAIHAGLEAAVTGGDWETAVREYFASHPCAPCEYRTADNAVEVVRLYLATQEPLLPVVVGEPLVERSFRLLLGEFPWGAGKVVVHYTGKIDLVSEVHGAVRVVDHKTTSVRGDAFTQDFVFGAQPIGYVWAARKLWDNLHVSGFCLNAISFKRPTGNGSLLDRGPRGGEPALAFFRCFYDYGPAHVDEWRKDVMSYIQQFVGWMHTDYFPKATKWCHGKYGQCPYFDVCRVFDKDMRMTLLASDMFTDNNWSPLNENN